MININRLRSPFVLVSKVFTPCSGSSVLSRNFGVTTSLGGDNVTQSNPQQQQQQQTPPNYYKQPSYTSNKQQSLFTDTTHYSEDKYIGISKEPFSKEIQRVLLADLATEDIEIKPDGLIYLPEIKYRRILNQAFGPGGWGLKAHSGSVVINGTLVRTYSLHCLGRYVSEAMGEIPYQEGGFLSFATATEAAKSNALVRCCKDLGIGSELWDPTFIRQWKQQYAQEKFYENVKTKDKRKLWTLKNGGTPIAYPWREIGGNNSQQSTSSPQQQQQYQQPPPQLELNNPNTQQQQLSEDILPVSNFFNAQQQQQTSTPSAAETEDVVEEIDLDSVVPPQLKKYAGKTWRDMLNDPKGISYIKWLAANFSDARIKQQAQAIVSFIELSQQQ